MPTHIFEPFTPEELSQASLAEPFPFTKGAKLLKVPVIERSPIYNVYGPGAMIENDTRLYDLATDPGQEKPMQDAGVEARLEQADGGHDGGKPGPAGSLHADRAHVSRRRPQSGRRQMNPGTLAPEVGRSPADRKRARNRAR